MFLGILFKPFPFQMPLAVLVTTGTSGEGLIGAAVQKTIKNLQGDFVKLFGGDQALQTAKIWRASSP